MREIGICLLAIALMSAIARAEDLSRLPEPVAVKGATPIMTLKGTGAQIYICTRGAQGMLDWSFREPVAALFKDGKTIGRHFVGPTWEFADGTRVTAKPEGKTPGANAADVPWLKLSIIDPANSGPATGATTILRIDTKGGAFAGECSEEGELHAEPYTATYVFLK